MVKDGRKLETIKAYRKYNLYNSQFTQIKKTRIAC